MVELPPRNGTSVRDEAVEPQDRSTLGVDPWKWWPWVEGRCEKLVWGRKAIQQIPEKRNPPGAGDGASGVGNPLGCRSEEHSVLPWTVSSSQGFGRGSLSQ